MRILFVGRTDHVHFRRWVEAFVRLGHDALALDVENARPSPIPGARVRGLASRHSRTALQVAEFKLCRVLFRPHLVHVHWVPYGRLPLAAGMRPLVVTAWGSDVLLPDAMPAEHNRIVDEVLAGADLVTCDSATMREVILGRLRGRGAVEVVQWGADCSLFRPDADVAGLRDELRLGPGPVVFNPRQLDPVYNPETVLDAVPRVLAKVPDAKFIFKHYIQEPERVAEIRGLAARLDLLEAVRFLDAVPYETMARLYALADVTVSVASSDGTPMSLLEAMAAGSVPVVSNLPSLREWIVDGVNGRVVEPRDSASLAEAIIALVRDRETRRRMREYNLRLIAERADQSVEMRKMDRLYRQLAGQQS